jgi:hypothetical protein
MVLIAPFSLPVFHADALFSLDSKSGFAAGVLATIYRKRLSVASHFEAGKTSKAPFETSRRMPRQCQRKCLS